MEVDQDVDGSPDDDEEDDEKEERGMETSMNHAEREGSFMAENIQEKFRS